MNIFIIENQITKETYQKLANISFDGGTNPLKEVQDLGFKLRETKNKNIKKDTIYSFEDTKYFSSFRILSFNFDTVGYILLNIENNYDLISHNSDWSKCPKCGQSFSNDVPFGELTTNQLSKVQNRNNVKACHTCLYIEEIDKDGKKIVIKNNQSFKLELI